MPADSCHNEASRRSWLAATARGFWALAAGVALSPRLASQVPTTYLTGTITDSTGEAVPDARVTITNKQTRRSCSTSSGPDGHYVCAELPAGTYDVTAAYPGFAVASQTDIVVDVGRAARADIVLTVGATEVSLPLITGRQFLVGESREEAGYGLYSYVLFGRRPVTDATRKRYLAVIAEYLAFPETVQLKRAVPKAQLNVTYLPTTREPLDAAPELVLNSYNYVQAQVLLAKVPGGPRVDGPYIISSEIPLSQPHGMLDGPYLYQDLSSVEPRIVGLWIREFMIQSGKEDYWRERNGPQAALRLRTAIATVAAGFNPTTEALKRWQGILASLLFWKSAS